jgi:hypothetical protein
MVAVPPVLGVPLMVVATSLKVFGPSSVVSWSAVVLTRTRS